MTLHYCKYVASKLQSSCYVACFFLCWFKNEFQKNIAIVFLVTP